MKYTPVNEQISVTSDFTQIKIHELLLPEAWSSLLQVYQEMSKFAVVRLLSFATTYIHEVVFSRFEIKKAIYRAARDMRVQLFTIIPYFWWYSKTCLKRTLY
jgi:hypothetical protein